MLRDTTESRILVNFALALFALYFVTMLAYGDNMPEGACRLWAFLMVYFFLVALAWSFVEALLLLLRLKMPSFGDSFLTEKYFWIALPCAWGKYYYRGINLKYPSVKMLLPFDVVYILCPDDKQQLHKLHIFHPELITLVQVYH